MGAIPKSDLPGHRLLHERATLALDRCQESEDVDFKESADWNALMSRITHSALGMGNLRDGGIIIVGVAQRNDVWALTGMSAAHLGTYDPDLITAHVNAYVSPHVDLDVVVVHHRDGREYLAIYVREFRDTPLVCKKNGPAGSNIVEGRIYVRLPAPPRTTAVTNAQQLHDLLELAAEKRARRILETAHRIGLAIATAPADTTAAGAKNFDTELEGL